MAEVYSNAFLTIAAAHSKDDSEGFLDSRPHIHMPIEFQVGKNNLYVSKVKVEGAPFQTDIQLMDNEPLHKRAWTLQERYLSPRALHYTKYQMFWECNGGVTAERGDYSPRTCCFDSILYGDPDIEPPWFATWIELVERYSCRKLTVASDRLPALSGMASRLAGATGDRYCAGVWQSRILHGISWQKKWSPTNYKSEDILPGPSWSWASISDPILFHPRVIEERGEPYVAHAIVLNYDIEHEGENLYGAVRSGRLTIRGPVLKFDTSKGSLHLFYWDRDDEERYPCFVLLLWTQGTGNPLDSDCQARGFVGLILKPTSSDHREFQRVGLMAPGIGKLGKDIPYKAEDVRDIILV
ncbi:hypothetical protein F5882DRAFT_404051 [Hyaloscypha sp. PMI_1271]|nr:hypothetical protein F5882DRAFT_404051 [Hyaloscypha sp. PMI_1271]